MVQKITRESREKFARLESLFVNTLENIYEATKLGFHYCEGDTFFVNPHQKESLIDTFFVNPHQKESLIDTFFANPHQKGSLIRLCYDSQTIGREFLLYKGKLLKKLKIDLLYWRDKSQENLTITPTKLFRKYFDWFMKENNQTAKKDVSNIIKLGNGVKTFLEKEISKIDEFTDIIKI